MTMMIDTTTEAAAAPSGPTLLTDNEIAAVGGGYLNRELPYIEAAVGVGGAIGSGFLAHAVLAGVILAASPALGTIAVVGCVAAAGVGMWMLMDGLAATVSK
jgi:hypothetical protein